MGGCALGRRRVGGRTSRAQGSPGLSRAEARSRGQPALPCSCAARGPAARLFILPDGCGQDDLLPRHPAGGGVLQLDGRCACIGSLRSNDRRTVRQGQVGHARSALSAVQTSTTDKKNSRFLSSKAPWQSIVSQHSQAAWCSRQPCPASHACTAVPILTCTLACAPRSPLPAIHGPPPPGCQACTQPGVPRRPCWVHCSTQHCTAGQAAPATCARRVQVGLNSLPCRSSWPPLSTHRACAQGIAAHGHKGGRGGRRHPRSVAGSQGGGQAVRTGSPRTLLTRPVGTHSSDSVPPMPPSPRPSPC